MIKDIELLIVLVFLLIGVVLVFNARFIVKNKLKSKNENIAVNILKVFGYLLCVCSLIAVFYIR